jgi:exocyst complex component 2
MALDCVRLYISLVSEFFALSDIVVMLGSGSSKNMPPMLPTNVHSISTAHYLMKLSGEIHESVNELNGMEISPEVSSGLKSLLESVKWRFTDILIHVWLRGVYSRHY